MPLIFTGAVTLTGAVEATGTGYTPPPPPPYFIAQGPDSSVSDGRSVAVDSLGNMYTVSSTTSGADVGIVKYSVSTGAVLWQYKIDSGSAGDNAKSIHIDSSDNIYIAGAVFGGVTFMSPGRLWIAKLNTSGAIQWQKHIAMDATGDASADAYDIVTDSSGNVIICGDKRNGTFIAKLNSSGVVQWFKVTNSIQQIRSLATDSSDNIYLMGQGTLYANGTYGVPLAVVKLNSSGVQQWNKTYGGSQLVGGLAVSSSGYVYASFNGAVSSGVGVILAKLSASDGSQVWQRTLQLNSQPAYHSGPPYYGVNGLPYTTTTGGSIAIDSSENVYWLSQISYNYDYQVGINNSRAVIAKYNSSGAIQWQNWMYRTPVLSHPNGFDYFNTITVDNSGNLCAVGKINNKHTLVKLPADGTLAGTYSVGGTSIVYGASNASDSVGPTSQATDNNQALTALTGYVETTTSYTPASTSYTITTVVIG